MVPKDCHLKKPKKLYLNDRTSVLEAAAEYGVVQIMRPPKTAEAFLNFLASLGSLMFTEGETPVFEHPLLNIVTNVNRKTKPKSVFQREKGYFEMPLKITALIAY